MKIGKKLTLNSIIILVWLAVVGGSSVFGISYIQKEIFTLTQKSTPYQIKAFNHQRTLQALAANLMKVSSSDSEDEFRQNSAKAGEALSEENKASEELSKLGDTSDSSAKTISDITGAIIDTTEKRLKLQGETQAAVIKMRGRLGEASKKLNELDTSIRNLQQNSAGNMVSSIDNSSASNQQYAYLTTISDSFKDLLIYISKIPATNDKRSMAGLKNNIETGTNTIIQTVKLIKWADRKTGDEIEQRVRDMNLKLSGAVSTRLKFINEEDESYKNKSDKITKDVEYEISYILPSVAKELGKANGLLKTSSGEMSKSVKSFSDTNNVLIQTSALISLSAFIDSQINYSLSVRNTTDFDKTVSAISDAFARIGTGQKIKDLLVKCGCQNALSPLNAAISALTTIKQGYLGMDGAAEKIKASLRNIEEVSKLNLQMKEIVSKRIQESSKDVTSAQASQEKAVASVKTAVHMTVIVVVIIAGIAVLTSIILSRWIISSISSPIKELNTMAEGFGAGDFSIRLDESRKDEFGTLAGHFNQATRKLNEITTHLLETIKGLATSSGGLSVTAEQLFSVAKAQVEQTEQSAAAISEISQTIINVSQNASDSSDASKEALKKASNGKDIVDKTVTRMNEIADSVRESATTITKLSESSEKIGAIVNMINDIAEQTNLLALNAAIEAARAGEQGRGFAVVADEVRKLAERTSQATGDIASLINEIHSDTERSVIVMNNGKAKVEQGVQFAAEASRSLQEIVSSSQRGVDLAHMIAAATVQQSSASEHVAQNMDSIKMTTGEMENSISIVKKESEGLAKTASELSDMASWFKAGNGNGNR